MWGTKDLCIDALSHSATLQGRWFQLGENWIEIRCFVATQRHFRFTISSKIINFFSFVISSHAMRGASFKRSFDKKALRVIVVGRTRIDRLSRVGEVSWKRTCSLSRRENRNRFRADHWDRNTDTTMATGKSSVHSKNLCWVSSDYYRQQQNWIELKLSFLPGAR